MFKRIIDLLRALFGAKGQKEPQSLPSADPTEAPAVEKGEETAASPDPAEPDDADDADEPETTEEPSDQPETEVDDPVYDIEHETDDDNTERDALPAPSVKTVEKIFTQMSPTDLWRERQQWLTDAGYAPGAVDGKPGRKTEAAVRAFQKDHGLEVDGMWGAKTQTAMEKALKEKSKPVPVPSIPPPPAVGPSKYEDMIGEVELDDGFWSCFVDLTSKSNVQDSEGRRRRKGSRPWKNLTRICWHQTAFTWRPYRESKAKGKFSGHHQINAHACFDTDGTILLIHNFLYYLWTANAFNVDCFSFEIMGNFEGVLGSGNWYMGDKFGRARPTRIQMIRTRQITKWLLDPEQGPADDALPKPLLEWRKAVRQLGFNPLKWNNAHRQATEGRVLDCGSECWYHVVMWGVSTFPALSVGPERGQGMKIPAEWTARPKLDPLPLVA
jgi:hypothetical protein